MELQLQNKVTAGKVNEADVADDNVIVKIIMVLYNNAFFIVYTCLEMWHIGVSTSLQRHNTSSEAVKYYFIINVAACSVCSVFRI